MKILWSILALSLIAVGCAAEPLVIVDPPVAGQGRIWFYRPFNSDNQKSFAPVVFLNGEIAGKVIAGCYFFIDRQPGDYEVKCSTFERMDKYDFKLAAGEEKYITFKKGFSWLAGRIVPKEMDQATAIKEISYAHCLLIPAGTNIDIDSYQPKAKLNCSPEIRKTSQVDNAEFRALLGGIGGVAMMDEALYPDVKAREVVEIKIITPFQMEKAGVEQWTIKHDGNKTASYFIKLIPDVRGNIHFAVEQDREK
jgi:hypothetical protein